MHLLFSVVACILHDRCSYRMLRFAHHSDVPVSTINANIIFLSSRS